MPKVIPINPKIDERTNRGNPIILEAIDISFDGSENDATAVTAMTTTIEFEIKFVCTIEVPMTIAPTVPIVDPIGFGSLKAASFKSSKIIIIEKASINGGSGTFSIDSFKV